MEEHILYDVIIHTWIVEIKVTKRKIYLFEPLPPRMHMDFGLWMHMDFELQSAAVALPVLGIIIPFPPIFFLETYCHLCLAN